MGLGSRERGISLVLAYSKLFASGPRRPAVEDVGRAARAAGRRWGDVVGETILGVMWSPPLAQEAKFAVVLEEDLDIAVDFFR